MNNYIKNVKITNLFGEKDVDWNLNKVNVLVGKNGLGKSTILRLINSALTLEEVNDIRLCNEVSVILNSGKTNQLKKDIDAFRMTLEKIKNNFDLSNFIKNTLKKTVNEEKITPELITALQNKVIDHISSQMDDVESYNSISDIPLGYVPTVQEVESLKTEFISTVNMSANSINTVTKSTGEHTTLLDIEIESEIKRLTDNISKNTEKELGSKFEDALNNFFKETGKKVQFIDEQLIITLENGKTLSFKHLSSGERQIIFIFLKVINGSVNRSLILMDEPEISLHLSWQEKLLDEITKVNDVSQIIIVTHSPAIVMNGWFDCLTDIDSIFTKNINNVEAT